MIRISLFSIFLLAVFFLNSCRKNPANGGGGPPTCCDPIDFRLTDSEPAWSPDGKTIAYVHGDSANGKSGIYLIDPSGNNKRLFYASPGAYDPTWSPNGQWLAFSDGGQIFKMKINGDSLTQLTTSGHNFFPAWSPDGKWIAYDSNNKSSNGMYFIWKMKSDSTQKQRIVYKPSVGEIRMPGWSPDGGKIVHQRYIGIGAPEIYTMDTAGQNALRLTYDNRFDSYPIYSPDGSKIAFTSQAEGAPPQIWVMDSNGSHPQQLTTTQGYTCDWSPDGEKIVYTDSRVVSGRLWIMNSDGLGKHQLTFD